jgi:hypothetical protein
MNIVTRKNFSRIITHNPVALLVDFTAATDDPEAAGKCIGGVFQHFDIFMSTARPGDFSVVLFGRTHTIPAKDVFAV